MRNKSEVRTGSNTFTFMHRRTHVVPSKNMDGDTQRFVPSPTVSIISSKQWISARGYLEMAVSNVFTGIFSIFALSFASLGTRTVMKLASCVKEENNPTQFPGKALNTGLKELV